MPSFLVQYLNFSTADVLQIFTLSLLSMLVAVPIFAWLCDKKDRETVLKIVLVLAMGFAVPYLYLLEQHSFYAVLAAQVILSILVGAYIAPIPTLVVELFPSKTRFTGMALACNLAATLFGGTSPMLITRLIAELDSNSPISAYLILAAIGSFISLIMVRMRRNRDLLYPV